MLISWIMIWPSAVMMDCSFSSSIWGRLALRSFCISGKFWITCWCETRYMVYQGQYPLMSGPGPCQENLFSRFSLYVDSCCVGREQPANIPTSMSSASVGEAQARAKRKPERAQPEEKRAALIFDRVI